jgi:cation diffusion facilitator CzcD-associated flavoprotein CzcO
MNKPDAGLTLATELARHDLVRLLYPAADWVPAHDGPVGAPLLDVLVVGAGMCGQTAAFGLLRDGVRKLRIVDRAARGNEGPWATVARMPTLRSPKHLSGPDLGVGSLTFRAWYEAQHGAEGWQALYKIPTLLWRDYLLWVRDTVGLPVENDTALIALEAHGELLRAELAGPRGRETVFARKVVLALGREGSGRLRWPAFPSFDPARAHGHVVHALTEFEVARFAGQRVAILGAGATAFDNAAAVLDAGATSATLFARRAHLPQVNKSKWTSFPGFFHGFVALPDGARWRFLTHVYAEQAPPPHESVLRCDAMPGFALRLGEYWSDLAVDDGGVTITTARGRETYDAAILATGFGVDMLLRPELAAFREQVLVWGDRVSASEALAHAEAAHFPYLGAGFEFLARDPGTLPAARNLHVFNWGAAMSHGQLAGDIPGLAIGVNRLVQAIARDLFVADEQRLYAALLAHEEPELQPTRWFVPAGR